MKPRTIGRVIAGTSTADGAGVRLTRYIGMPGLEQFDPFLLFDMFGSDKPGDYIAGFPDHPHRGFETVTYMFAGRMRHGDSKGHSGVIEAGDVQWMTAGRGLIHSEMPEQEDGLLAGIQLWINLPARDKMTDPKYQEYRNADLPREIRGDDCSIIVVAGTTSRGTAGAVTAAATDARYLDIQLDDAAVFDEPLPVSHNAMLYVVDGAITVGADDTLRVPAGRMVLLGDGDTVRIRANHGAARVLLIAGRALHEPVVRAGPFVMNTNQELQQAFADFRSGRLD